MSVVHTSIVTDAHAYTRERIPWIIGEHKSVYGKLIHYLSGGGMSAFGRTISQEKARRRHIRFFVFAGVFALVWLYYLVF